METRLTLRPGVPGTKKLLARYGERLVCVRYLYDEARGRRLKTVELVIDEAFWSGRPRRPRRDDSGPGRRAHRLERNRSAHRGEASRRDLAPATEDVGDELGGGPRAGHSRSRGNRLSAALPPPRAI